MKKLTLKLIPVLLVFTLVLSGITFNVNALNIGSKSGSGGILLLTEKANLNNNVECRVNDSDVKGSIISKTKAEFENYSANDIDTLWIDADTIAGSEISSNLNQLYNDNKKIIIKKKNIKIYEVFKILGISGDYADIYDKDYNDPSLKVIGFMIKKEYIDAGYFPTILRVEKDSNDEITKELFYSTKSDFIDKKLAKNISLISFKTAYADWQALPTTKPYSDHWTSITVEGSIQLQRCSTNPVGGTTYYGITKSEMRLSPASSSYYYKDFSTYQDFTGTIYTYGPPDNSGTKNFSFSFSYPFSISFSFSPTSSMQVAKVNGGYNTSTLGLAWTPKDPLAQYTPFINYSNYVQTAAETQQTSSYAQSGFTYTVKTYSLVNGIMALYGTASTTYYLSGNL